MSELISSPWRASSTAAKGSYWRAMKRLRDVRQLVAANGFRWTVYFGVQYALRAAAHTVDHRMSTLERANNLPGFNSVRRNYQLWQTWNWESLGEEWTVSEQWKAALIDDVLLKYIRPEVGETVLEIGPGGGRWTETLQRVSPRLVIVDVSDKCIELCKKRFMQCMNLECFVNNGTDLGFVADCSISYIWSFDVFVHISPPDIETYLVEFGRVLRHGGRGVIHHANGGTLHGGWRSRMTAELFAQMLQRHGLTLVTQFDSWGDRNQHNVQGFKDIISVFEK
jgi:ubiquinone/menaquinone biosynthesis C-methylase UbiE